MATASRPRQEGLQHIPSIRLFIPWAVLPLLAAALLLSAAQVEQLVTSRIPMQVPSGFGRGEVQSAFVCLYFGPQVAHCQAARCITRVFQQVCIRLCVCCRLCFDPSLDADEYTVSTGNTFTAHPFEVVQKPWIQACNKSHDRAMHLVPLSKQLS